MDMNNLHQKSIELADQLCKRLIETRDTVSTAESCTGGLLGSFITAVSGSSEVYLGGIISYCNDIKEQFLGVDRVLLKDDGAVSDSVALAMVRGCRMKFGSSFAVSITGIAGPGGGTEDKPVGLVYIAVASVNKTVCEKCMFSGTREDVRLQSVIYALEMLLVI
jgi:nicotinamide-nucleotide amidase